MDPGAHSAIDDLLARFTGPMHMRMYMQPLMATIFGIRDGWKDAKESKPPYFWTIFSDPADRGAYLKNGFRSEAKILAVAMILDAIYQITALHRFRIDSDIFVALMLAFVPYMFIRGPANRFARRRQLMSSPHPDANDSR
jgi:hypothetical protein